ncbi:hypothetical protein F4808DRAFT_443380 [Astrocystis sublimbata]|nr:hypothetical protein F4808DRAFT_443380 [Astrocystis sublimbata]
MPFYRQARTRQFDRAGATKRSGIDPDYSKRNLLRTIENGEAIEGTAKVQIIKLSRPIPTCSDFHAFGVTNFGRETNRGEAG